MLYFVHGKLYMPLFLARYGCLLDAETSLVVLDVLVEAFHILGGGGDFNTGVAGKDYAVEILVEGQSLGVVYQIGCQQGHTPRASFAGGLHNRDGRVDGGGKDALTYTCGLEETSVAGDAVDLDLLFVEEDVVTNLEYTY